MCESVGFPEKRKSLAGTLSGGQKRRLCVALSMVGGNSVVYLDEPTAGELCLHNSGAFLMDSLFCACL